VLEEIAMNAGRPVKGSKRDALTAGDTCASQPLRSASGACDGVDQTAPNAARIYDWLLGGKDNYQADREAARRLLLAGVPGLADDDRPAEIIQAITERIVPGSYLAISHVTADDITPGAQKAARAAYAGASVPVQPRSRAEVTRLLAGLDTVPPGITDVRAWHRPCARPAPPVLFWGGAARIPSPTGRPGRRT
jgi:hypothetical protein